MSGAGLSMACLRNLTDCATGATGMGRRDAERLGQLGWVTQALRCQGRVRA